MAMASSRLVLRENHVFMYLVKTPKGVQELKPGQRSLSQRDRTFLVLANGQKSVDEMRALFAADGAEIIARLVDDGYLEVSQPVAPQSSATKPPSFNPLSSGALRLASNPAQQAPRPAGPPPAVSPPAPAPQSTDQFEGKRSLATTRMFLFDICERMFARRDPVMAERFRNGLREAKDRESMLAVSRDMINEIETVAGHERADSISERIAMLLPSETTA